MKFREEVADCDRVGHNKVILVRHQSDGVPKHLLSIHKDLEYTKRLFIVQIYPELKQTFVDVDDPSWITQKEYVEICLQLGIDYGGSSEHKCVSPESLFEKIKHDTDVKTVYDFSDPQYSEVRELWNHCDFHVLKDFEGLLSSSILAIPYDGGLLLPDFQFKSYSGPSDYHMVSGFATFMSCVPKDWSIQKIIRFLLQGKDGKSFINEFRLDQHATLEYFRRYINAFK